MISKPHLMFVIALLTLLCSAACAHGDSGTGSPYNPIIHVRLARFFAGASGLLISCNEAFVLKDSEGKTLGSAGAGEVAHMAIGAGDRLLLDDPAGDEAALSSTGEVTVSPMDSAGILQVASDPSKWHHYRGSLRVGLGQNGLVLTNDVPMEAYLCGVLKPEIGPSAPLETLKAQAVAARTYAVHNLGRLVAEGADLDDTTRTQGYVGADGEAPAICTAVRQTTGLVMTYEGQTIEAVYSTDCGGETALGAADEPYLQPVADPDCAAKPPWTKTYTSDELEEALDKSTATSMDGLVSLKVDGVDKSGRVTSVDILGTDGQVKTVSGPRLRQVLGTNNLRSTLFAVACDNGTFTFTGRGWGHGMGLCQQGAIFLAQGANPMPYEKILTHYYTGIQIVPLTPALVEEALRAHPAPAGLAHTASSTPGQSGGRS